jgi:hypothetical protein
VASNEPIFQGQFNQSLARQLGPAAAARRFPPRRRAMYGILIGTSPGEIPVELPSKFELVVNMKTARLLGIKIPNSILLRATKVIE